MSQECTTEDCANHTSTYLCGQCVSDLQQWLDKVPTLITELSVTVSRLDQIRPANAGWNSGGVPGSAAPINLDALQLQENLRSVGRDAKAYAQDERAAGLAWLIQDWITKAELLVSGPEEVFTYGTCGAFKGDDEPPCPATLMDQPGARYVECGECGKSHDIQQRRRNLTAQIGGEPLPPREVREFLREKANLVIKAKDLENWVALRRLPYVHERVTTDTKPRRIFFPGDVFKIAQEMRERRLKV
jgi:hypothetical protein